MPLQASIQMGPASRNLKQTITYWAPAALNDWGQKGFSAPKKILGRWTEGRETITRSGGEEYISKAVVFVSQDVEQNGYLALGDFFSNAVANPTLVDAAYEIQAYRATPDLRNLEQERKAYL